MKRVKIKILGDVHGVGFRYSAVQLARDLELVGFVRNNQDGSVEIIAEGEKEKLENLITWAKKGPPFSKVEKIDVSWSNATGEFSGFGLLK